MKTYNGWLPLILYVTFIYLIHACCPNILGVTMTRKVKATLYIQEDKREKIRKSGMSLEEYFNKIFDTYEKFRLDTWRDGCFMMEYFRVCLLRAETLNSLLDNIEGEKQYEIGRELSEKLLTILKGGVHA